MTQYRERWNVGVNETGYTPGLHRVQGRKSEHLTNHRDTGKDTSFNEMPLLNNYGLLTLDDVRDIFCKNDMPLNLRD